MIKELIKKLKIEDIGEPPYEYDLLISLDEREYPKYLKRMFKKITGQKLNLKNPKTFNEKIQWLKLYDASPIKTRLTDKVLVRDWVSEKIGSEYLKPVLWIGKNFDDIPFSSLPSKFIIKANHGCKWHYKIKDKDKFLQEEKLLVLIKSKFEGWMSINFFPWAGFELQYKDIVPQIIIEPLLTDENDPSSVEYEIYCFNGVPKLFQRINYRIPAVSCVYNENFQYSDIKFNPSYIQINKEPEDQLKKAVELSKKLAEDFKLVRVDWLLYNNRIYFNEMTFTPFSGFFQFENKNSDLQLGSMLKL